MELATVLMLAASPPSAKLTRSAMVFLYSVIVRRRSDSAGGATVSSQAKLGSCAFPPDDVPPLELEVPDEPLVPLPPELELPDPPELPLPDEPDVPLPPLLEVAPEPVAAPLPEPGDPDIPSGP